MTPVTPTTVDLNSDVGESFGRWVLGDDEAVLASVTSANVACGFHAGDPTTLRRTCELAAAAGVVVGAQVGYRDLAGFGRRFIDMDPRRAHRRRDLPDRRAAGDRRGQPAAPSATSNRMARCTTRSCTTRSRRRPWWTRCSAVDPDLPLLGLPGSALLAIAAERGLRTVPEAFADRGYTAGGHTGASFGAGGRAVRSGRGRAASGPDGHRRHRRGRRRDRQSTSGPRASACTVTARARCRWPARSRRRWARPG